jgi:O-antigen ligase
MAETMTDRIGKVFPYLLIAPAVLPLVYFSGVLYPYVAPKMFLLQGLGILALAVFSHLALSGRPFFYGRLRIFATWIPAVLLLVEYVTSFFGIGFHQSFWGLFARGDGLLTSTTITVFFYLILISADRQFLERLIKTVAIVAGFVAGIAVLQWLTAVFGEKVWFLPPVSGRIGSTFGNAAFLAGYLGMALFAAIVVMRDSTGFWSRICKISAILSAIAIILTATRGTMLAILLSVVVALAFSIWNGNDGQKRIAAYGLASFVILSGFFFIFRSELAQTSFEPIRRIATISLSDGTVSSRLFVWSGIFGEAIKRPFLGYGAEHVAQLFDKVYDPSKIIEQWFDRSHNAFLDYLAQYGIFGLASYIAIICAFIIYALRLYRREEPSVTNYGFLFLLLIFTYTVQNFFVFDTPYSLWLLYAFFAFLIVLLSDVDPIPAFRSAPIISAVVSVCIVFLMIPAIAFPFYANIMLTNGYLYHLTDVNKANAYFEKGIALGTFADLEYGYQAYDMYTGRQVTQLKGDDLVSGYQYALSILTANFNKYPYDARTATYLGHVIDTAPPGMPVDDIFDKEVLDRAMDLSPLREQAWYMTANIYLRKADILPAGSKERETHYREAINVLETYVEKEPMLPVPRYILATIYYALGDKETAKKFADGALPLYKDFNPAAAKPAVKYYIATKDWRNAMRFLADIVKESPLDYNVLYDLAKVTYLAGDPEVSLRIVNEIRNKDPGIIGSDQNFLNTINAYEQSK